MTKTSLMISHSMHGDSLIISHKQMPPGKTNEIVYLQEMLENTDIIGFLITLNTIHTQTKTAKKNS